MRLAGTLIVTWLAVAGSALAQEVVPVADAGPDLTVACAGPDGTPVNLNGLASSMGTGFTYLWTAPGVTFNDPTILTPLGLFPVGVTEVTLTVTFTDPDTEVATSVSDTTVVTVGDANPPMILGLADPDLLWPPNHRLHDIHVDLLVFDVCDDEPFVELLSISSNESDNGRGDGNTSGDIQGADVGTDDRDFALRAERSGPGSGRVYTAVYRATDLAGNHAESVVRVIVPHDMGHRAANGDDDAWHATEKAIAQARKAAAKAAKLQMKAAKKAAKAAKKAYKQALRAARAAER